MLRALLRLLGMASVTSAAAASAAPGDAPSYAQVFLNAFDPSFAVDVDDAPEGSPPQFVRTAFRSVAAGTLILTSGRIVAADPFVNLVDTPPFPQPVPNGRFPVTLAVANGGLADGRVAFARVVFSAAPVVRWQMAVVEGQDISTLKPGEHFGYPVDAGTGSFFDPAASAEARKLYAANPDVWQPWQQHGEANGEMLIGPGSFVLDQPFGPVNAVMFHSGWGDGLYGSWFGLDAAGSPAQLVTDFNVIDWERAKGF